MNPATWDGQHPRPLSLKSAGSCGVYLCPRAIPRRGWASCARSFGKSKRPTKVSAILSAMTKVQTTFTLSRPLSDRDLKEIARVHSVYGMLNTRVEPSGDALFIEYDASRLSRKEVSAILEEHGFPLAS